MTRKVKPGQVARPLSAADFNRISSAADAYTRGPDQQLQPSEQPEPCIVYVRNSAEVEVEESPTAVDLSIGSVLKLGNTLLSDKNNDSHWYNGTTPDGDPQRVCVLREPIMATKIGLAQVLGVVFARVNVTDTDHTFVSVGDGETDFTSGSSGQFPMLTVPTETGIQLAAILLDRAGGDLIVKTPSGGIAARSSTTIYSALCIICTEVDSATAGQRTITETANEIRVYNIYPDAVSGSVYVPTSLTKYGTRYVTGEECEE